MGLGERSFPVEQHCRELEAEQADAVDALLRATPLSTVVGCDKELEWLVMY